MQGYVYGSYISGFLNLLELQAEQYESRNQK